METRGSVLLETSGRLPGICLRVPHKEGESCSIHPMVAASLFEV